MFELDDENLIKIMSGRIKNGSIIAITKCCSFPMSLSDFKITTCRLCGLKKSLEDEILFYDPNTYKEKIKKESN